MLKLDAIVDSHCFIKKSVPLMQMENDLQITLNGLPAELADKIGKAIGLMVANLAASDPPLDFRRMHRIIVTSDFAGELTALSSKTASGNPITYTNEDFGQAVAKVLLLPKGESFEIVPVINAFIVKALTEPEVNARGFEYVGHVLHHEFCHVHDDNKKLDAFPNILLQHRYQGKDTILGPITEGCWSEYIANFLSSSTAPNDAISIMIESFDEALKRTKEETDLQILRYRCDENLENLLSTFRRRGEFLTTSAAYVLGYLDGLGKSLEEISAETATSLSGSYFEPIWLKLQTALRELRQSYPDGWKNFSIFDSLKAVLEDYYSVMGFNITTVEDGMAHVAIPMRPETNPVLNFVKVHSLFYPKI